MTATTAIAARVHPELRALRRAIHADPELGNDNPRTQARILDALAGLDLEITTGTSLTSVVAVLRGGAETTGTRPVVLLRPVPGTSPIHGLWAGTKLVVVFVVAVVTTALLRALT